MTAFLIVAAIMIVIAFALILPPLFRKGFSTENQSIENDANLSIGRERLRDLKNDLRDGRIDQQQFDHARSELEQNLAQTMSEKKSSSSIKKNNPLLAILLAITLPFLAAGIYMKTGLPEALDPGFENKLVQQQEAPDVGTMITALADRLKQTPEDGEGWLMLGRSYIAMNRFKEAEDAFQRAHKILDDDVSLLADYADAIGRGNNSDLTGDAKPLIERALTLDPNHPKSRWLAGMLAYQEREFEKVTGFLQPLLQQTEPGSEIHEGLKRLIEEAQSQTQDQSGDISLNNEKDQQTISVNVKVSLSEEFNDQVDAEDIVFIFAKAIQGPPMPLAVKKLKVKDLPVTVTLDDSLAMRPDLKISSHEYVTISARISKSGNAISSSGDFQGEVFDIDTGNSESVEILINKQIP